MSDQASRPERPGELTKSQLAVAAAVGVAVLAIVVLRSLREPIATGAAPLDTTTCWVTSDGAAWEEVPLYADDADIISGGPSAQTVARGTRLRIARVGPSWMYVRSDAGGISGYIRSRNCSFQALR